MHKFVLHLFSLIKYLNYLLGYIVLLNFTINCYLACIFFSLCVCAYLRLTHLRHIHTRRTHTHTHTRGHVYMASMGRLSVSVYSQPHQQLWGSSCAYAAVFCAPAHGARHEKSIDSPHSPRYTLPSCLALQLCATLPPPPLSLLFTLRSLLIS